jgi:lipopolysaccharide export system permease protein
MNDVTEILIEDQGRFEVTRFPKLPLLIDETPSYFYKVQQLAETLSYSELKEYIEKLSNDGVPVTQYLVDLAAKISFPFVNLIVVLVAFPLALISARSGNVAMSVVFGIIIGFSYYVVHAICTSLGSAELIPVIPAAWAANILLGSIGGYLLMGAEFRQ